LDFLEKNLVWLSREGGGGKGPFRKRGSLAVQKQQESFMREEGEISNRKGWVVLLEKAGVKERIRLK